ncbi:MAG: hypothetical protein C0179_02935 [Fervidicoccus sp.]|nr:MAG: hypothetical protein C0179_02935 [Fervidicoccus sp.]
MSTLTDREEKRGIFGWFRGLFGSTSARKPDWEEMVQDIIVRLKNEQDRFEELEYRTKKRIDELFSKIVENIKMMDLSTRDDEKKTYQNLGKVYAEEVYELRSFLKAIRFAKISFERVIQRLQTVKDIHDFQTVLGPVASMLNGVKTEISAIFPKAGETIDDINRIITDIMLTTTSGNQYNANHNFMVNEEVEKILNEAWKQADSSVEAELPEPEKLRAKATPQAQTKTEQPSKVVVQLPTSGLRSRSDEELENAVLEEIKKNGGKVIVTELSSKLGVDKDKIYEILYNLSKKGKIKISFPSKK